MAYRISLFITTVILGFGLSACGPEQIERRGKGLSRFGGGNAPAEQAAEQEKEEEASLPATSQEEQLDE